MKFNALGEALKEHFQRMLQRAYDVLDRTLNKAMRSVYIKPETKEIADVLMSLEEQKRRMTGV